MRIFRSPLIALAFVMLIACGDDGGAFDEDALADSGAEEDAAMQPSPGEIGEKDVEGDGDPDGDDPDGDDPDGDDPDGDDPDGDDPGGGEPVHLILRIVNQDLEPLAGATVRVLGIEAAPILSDDDGAIAIEVPVRAHYLVSIAPPDGSWAVASIFEAGGEESGSFSVMFPDRPLEETYGELIGLPLSDETGVVLFLFTDVTPGGQSISLPEGQPFIQLAPEPPNETGLMVPGMTLVSGGGNAILYAELPPGKISPIYASPIADENCRSIDEPFGGWSAIERNVVLVQVRCL